MKPGRLKLRDKSSPDRFESFLIKKTESTVDKAFLWLAILKLLKKKSMSGEELRRTLTSKGFVVPHRNTVYSTLKMLKVMKMIEEAGPIFTERGKEKPYTITEKGGKIFSRATEHLKTRMTLLHLV